MKTDRSAEFYALNPMDCPMIETDYFKWLEGNALENIHSIETKRAYLLDHFKLDRDTQYIEPDCCRVLRWIEQHYFDLRLKEHSL